ncbi:MAG: class I SAM-dependent methyltransferase [Anaerolineaceae bacterium]|nr:class I SAM-dependent methyltransferase [Anaerolineaceae bacterium]
MKQNAISYDAYQQMAAYYGTMVDEKPINALYERPGTVALLPDVDGLDVLEAGCAAGWYTQYLITHGASVTALDFSPDMLEWTRKRIGDHPCCLIEWDLNQPLSFAKDATYDMVLSSLTLHYLQEWDDIFREFYRVLRPGGILVFSIHNPMMIYDAEIHTNYYQKQLVRETWRTPMGDFHVEFYRRPFSEVLRPLLDADFLLEKATEPKPLEAMEEINEKDYEHISTRPRFLFLRARKPGNAI